MFWRFGGYATISTIDSLLDKGDVSLEELLDESDLIQELKQHNTKLIEYLREETVLERLLEYVTAPKLEPVAAEQPEEQQPGASPTGKERSLSRDRESAEDKDVDKEKKRNRYAYVSAEILSSDNWSICETLMEEQRLLRKFWDFVKLPPPLDPLQAGYFTKVNESLFDKKTDEMLDLFKSLDGIVKNLLQHVDSPMIMDLLLKIVSLEKAEGGQGILEWLYTQDLMPILLSFLSPEHNWSTQTSAGDFLKAIITISANASQNEASCIGPNELTRQLVSQPCVEELIADMLKGGNPLTVGVGIIIEVIRKNNSDYDPDVGDANAPPTSRDPIYLGTLLRLFAQHVPDFMDLILSPNHTVGGGDGPVSVRRKELRVASGSRIEPLGFDRFKTCELMAELLHCSNMGLLNELGSEEFIKARDEEREKLRVEGKLKVSNEQTNIPEEDHTMNSSTNNRLGSPDSSRKLEVQNASDDDFEEVTHSNDLGDESKDELIEKPDIEEDLPSRKSDMPLLFLDKDDDFVDEPLSSPRLHPEKRQMDEPDMMVQPLSPSKELSQQVGSLGFKEEDTPMTSPPPSIDTVTEGSEASTNESSHDSPGTSDASNDSPPRKEAQHPEDPTNTGEPSSTEDPISTDEATIIAQPTGQVEALAGDTPHTEDALETVSTTKPEASISEHHESPQPHPEHSDSADTTMGEAGDSSNSVVAGNVNENLQTSNLEQPVTPVVGDFLKMQFVDHKVVPTILDFFFRFPWNNFLHNVVYDVVQQVFNGPMDRGFNRSLAIDLFETGNITMRIVDGQKKSDESQMLSKMRLGYMGHLTLIAEEVVKFTERHPPELLSETVLEKVMNGEWITYVEVTLAETRERDNAILGGVRPDMVGNPRQVVMNAVKAASNFGPSSALADAGLNGAIGLDSIDLANGSGATGNNFGIGGNLLSGFGSSSDEEDDEMDEDNEEGVGNTHSAPEFSRYITGPSTTTSTSIAIDDLAPPSIPPPPPPPLNIPPSRARRQLAARLALHKQNAANNPDERDPGNSERRKNLNPFTSAEEDDEDNDEDFTIGDMEAEEESKARLAGTSFDHDFEYEDAPREKIVGNPDSSSSSFEYAAPVTSSSMSPSPSFISSPLSLFGTSTSNAGATSSFLASGLGARAKLSTMVGWPFGLARNSNSPPKSDFNSTQQAVMHQKRRTNKADTNLQQSDSSDEEIRSDDDEDEDEELGYGDRLLVTGLGLGEKEEERGRRLSVTREAERRTSLEEEDEEDEEEEGEEEDGVVHVGLSVGDRPVPGKARPSIAMGTEDDGELIEIQHPNAEMPQGLEGDDHTKLEEVGSLPVSEK